MTEAQKLRKYLDKVIEVIDYLDGNLLQMPAVIHAIRALSKEGLDTTVEERGEEASWEEASCEQCGKTTMLVHTSKNWKKRYETLKAWHDYYMKRAEKSEGILRSAEYIQFRNKSQEESETMRAETLQELDEHSFPSGAPCLDFCGNLETCQDGCVKLKNP